VVLPAIGEPCSLVLHTKDTKVVGSAVEVLEINSWTPDAAILPASRQGMLR